MKNFETPHSGCVNLTQFCLIIPDSHSIFFTPPACSRIIGLTAQAEGRSDDFTMVNLTPEDLIDGRMEELIIDETTDIIHEFGERGERLPRIFQIFVSCVDGFVGTDHEYVFRVLRERFPELVFMDLAMDPINREHLAPLKRFRQELEKLGDEELIKEYEETLKRLG